MRAGLLAHVFEGAPVQLVCRFALAALFFYAALPKIADPAAFAKDIANYRLLPESLVNALAVTLPFIELVMAVLLVVGIGSRGAALLCTLLLLVFTGATAAAVYRGLDIECGCFGKSEGARVGWGIVARDCAFLVPALVVTLFDRGRYGLLPRKRRGARECE